MTPEARTTRGGPAGARTRMRVLIVEDIEMNRDLLVQLLEEVYEIACAFDGEDGLAQALSWRPDVVLLDLSLPKMDGWTVARRLADAPGRGAMTVVALTAHAMASDRDTALAAGCDSYLPKPLDEDALVKLLDAADLGRGARP